MSEVTPISFENIEPTTVPVKLGNETYTLREASGITVAAYTNRVLECTTLGPDGKPQRVKGLADLEAFLVAKCLQDKDGKFVPEATVKAWPNRIIKKLYKTVRDISELEDEEPAKNELSDTMDGSD